MRAGRSWPGSVVPGTCFQPSVSKSWSSTWSVPGLLHLLWTSSTGDFEKPGDSEEEVKARARGDSLQRVRPFYLFYLTPDDNDEDLLSARCSIVCPADFFFRNNGRSTSCSNYFRHYYFISYEKYFVRIPTVGCRRRFFLSQRYQSFIPLQRSQFPRHEHR